MQQRVQILSVLCDEFSMSSQGLECYVEPRKSLHTCQYIHFPTVRTELNSNKIAVCKGAPKSWNLQLNFILVQENVAIPTDFITLLCLAFPMSFWRISYVSSSSVRTETYSISPSLTFLTQQFFPCSSAECASVAVFSLMLVSVPLHEYISIYSISY